MGCYLESVPAYYLLPVDNLALRLEDILRSSQTLKECMHPVRSAFYPFNTIT